MTESWVFEEPGDGSLVSWDTLYRFENLNSFTLKNYMAFFACYHQPGKNYYWDSKDELSECTDVFRAFSSDDEKQRDQEIVTPFRDIVKGWGIQDPTRASVLYGMPVMISEKREWFGNGRHVFFVEPEKCLSIVSAMNQARDYMLSPEKGDLEPQESFSARARHVIGDITGMDDLKRRWGVFINDIADSRLRT